MRLSRLVVLSMWLFWLGISCLYAGLGGSPFVDETCLGYLLILTIGFSPFICVAPPAALRPHPKGSTNPDQDYMEKIHPEKMRLSLEYLETRSLGVDVGIILRTLAAILGYR